MYILRKLEFFSEEQNFKNPMVNLFYGRRVIEGENNGEIGLLIASAFQIEHKYRETNSSRSKVQEHGDVRTVSAASVGTERRARVSRGRDGGRTDRSCDRLKRGCCREERPRGQPHFQREMSKTSHMLRVLRLLLNEFRVLDFALFM